MNNEKTESQETATEPSEYDESLLTSWLKFQLIEQGGEWGLLREELRDKELRFIKTSNNIKVHQLAKTVWNL